MEDTIADRVQWIIDKYYRGHAHGLARAIGASPATFTQILNSGAKPSWKITTAILKERPDINPDWFLHGQLPKVRSTDTEKRKIIEANMHLRKLIEKLYEDAGYY